MNEADEKIVEILKQDGRTPVTTIAANMRMSESTVRKRMKMLEEKGVIKGYSAVVDPAKMGFTCVSYLGVDVEPESYLHVARELSKLPEAIFVATSTGDHMIIAEVWTKDVKHLYHLIDERIYILDGVKRVCPTILMERLKG